MRYVVAAGRRLAILAANGLLASDDDLDGNPLTVVVRYSLSCTTTTTMTRGGNLTVNEDGNLVYVPPTLVNATSLVD